MFFTDGDGNVSGQFTNGDPTIPEVATQVNADWLNMVQDEPLHLLAVTGITPDKADNTQLLAATQKLFGCAWAYCSTNGSGGVTLLHGQGFSGAVPTLVGSTVKLTFDSPLADTNYGVTVSPDVVSSLPRYNGGPLNRDVAWVEVVVGDLASIGGGGPAVVNLATTALKFLVVVHGSP